MGADDQQLDFLGALEALGLNSKDDYMLSNPPFGVEWTEWLSVAEKRIIIIAGPNGAGKTTFAREFLPADLPACCRHLAADR